MARGDDAGALFDVAPLPPFAAAAAVVRDALPSLEPMRRVTVADTATQRMILADGNWIPFRHDVAPYMVEPMEMVTSRRFDSIGFVGPARSSKSEGLVINPLAHAILAQPRKVAVFSPTKDAAAEWSQGALDEIITNSPALAAMRTTGRGADNIFTKRFRGGTRLTIDWPVKQKLAQRSLDLVIGTDYDAFDDDIGGDGGAFPLMRKRTESAGSRAMTIVESSPRKPILDEGWTPKTLHEAPPCEGIVAIYNAGSRGRLYWPCDCCGEWYEPRFDRLRYPDDGAPADRGAAAVMVCPDCGFEIGPKHKADRNARSIWLHEEADGRLVRIGDMVRNVTTATYWLPGPAAALASWARIVSRYLEAEAEYLRTGNEGSLKAVVNTEHGLPHLPRSLAASDGLSEQRLRAGASDHAWKTCPAGTAFVTAAVDVQAGRFVVQVEAWLPGLERVVIDRYDLHTPPPGAPGADGRRIDPARFGEDWDILHGVAERVYPVAGAAHGLRPVAVIVDSQGEAGVTPNAYAFYRRARLTHPRRFYVQRGRGGDGAKRAVLRRPETAHAGKQYAARDIPIIHTGTDRLKDEVAASLLRPDPGPLKLHVPRLAPSDVFAEYAAERRYPTGWDKRPGVTRNEALDLSVYNLSLAIILEAEAINWDRPPGWAVSGPDNIMARPIDGAAPPAEPAAVAGPVAVRAIPAADPAPAPVAASNPAAQWAVRRPKSRSW